MKRTLVLILAILLVSIVAGETITINQQEEYSIGINKISIVDVSKDSSFCGVKVNGQTKWLEVGEEEYFHNVYVKVLDAIAVNALDQDRDACHLIITVIKGREPCPDCFDSVEEEVNETNLTTPEINTTEVIDEVLPVNETEEIQPITEEKNILNIFYNFIDTLKRILNIG